VAGFCEHGNESSGFRIMPGFLEGLSVMSASQ
jgi:hypothetical protein